MNRMSSEATSRLKTIREYGPDVCLIFVNRESCPHNLAPVYEEMGTDHHRAMRRQSTRQRTL